MTEEILFTQTLPDQQLVKTSNNLYIVDGMGTVAIWCTDNDSFMGVDKFEIGEQFIKYLRHSAFPNLFPHPTEDL